MLAASQTVEVTRIELIKACKSHPEIAQMLGIPENLRDSARAQFEQVYPGFALLLLGRHCVGAIGLCEQRYQALDADRVSAEKKVRIACFGQA